MRSIARSSPLRQAPLRAILVLLVAISVLPVLAFSGQVLHRLSENEAAVARQRQLDLTRALSQGIDREMKRIVGQLEVIAQSPALRSRNFAGFHAFAEQLRPVLSGTIGGIVLLDRSGQQLVNTNVPWGGPLPRRTSMDTIRRVLETGQPQISDLFIGVPQNRLLLSIDVPVRGDDGQIAAILSTGIMPDALTSVLEQHPRPEGWIVAVADRQGKIIARIPAKDFVGQPINETIQRQAAVAEADVFENTTRDGISVYTGFVRSSLTGWTIVLGAPRSEMNAPREHSLRLLLLGGAALLLLGLALAYWLGRGVAATFRNLARAAVSVSQDQPVGPLPRAGFREAADIAAALQTSNRIRQERDVARASALSSLELQLEHQRMLTLEVGHRVKNNLQMVAGLLSLQSAGSDPLVARALNEAVTRIATIARVHDRLWRQAEAQQIDLSQFIADLCADLAATAPHHELRCLLDPVTASSDLAAPLGLIVNELVTNAFKHAYPGSGGLVLVRLEWVEGNLRLEVCDHGVGVPERSDRKEARQGLGMRVVRALAMQLGTTISVEAGVPHGARFVLSLSDMDAASVSRGTAPEEDTT